LILVPVSFLYSQSDTASFDKIFLNNGDLVECKVDTIKTDTVLVTVKGSGLKIEYDKSSIKFILLSNNKYMSFPDKRQSNKNTDELAGLSPLIHKVPPLKTYVVFFGGLSTPVGEFASTTGSSAGYAKTGFAFGGEVNVEVARNSTLGFVASYNIFATDAATMQNQFRQMFGTNDITLSASSWGVFTGFATIGFYVDVSTVTKISVMPEFGVCVGTSPEISGTANGVSFSQSQATSTTVGYGFGLGVLIREMLSAEVTYFSAEPQYEVTVRAGSMSSVGKYKQPTSSIRFQIGYVIVSD
jgi:hypothetical protein